jgi:hypothetical protein
MIEIGVTAAQSVNRLMLVIVDVLAGWFEVWGLGVQVCAKSPKVVRWVAVSLNFRGPVGTLGTPGPGGCLLFVTRPFRP